MSVFIMLYILWQGILGFLMVVASTLYFFAVLHEEFGKKAVAVVIGVIGVVLIGLWVHSWGDAERNANGFLDGWAAASADFPEGRAMTREMPEFMDMHRLRNYDGYFANHMRLLSHSPVRQVGKESVVTDRNMAPMEGLDFQGIRQESPPVPVPSKVFLSQVKMFDSEADIGCTATMRIWIARDNDLVVKFMLEDLVFQQ